MKYEITYKNSLSGVIGKMILSGRRTELEAREKFHRLRPSTSIESIRIILGKDYLGMADQ